MKAEVSLDGLMLEHAPSSCRSNKEIVMLAVAQNGEALQHAAEGMRKDQEVVLLAWLNLMSVDQKAPWKAFHTTPSFDVLGIIRKSTQVFHKKELHAGASLGCDMLRRTGTDGNPAEPSQTQPRPAKPSHFEPPF